MRWLAPLAAVSVVTPPVPLAGQSGRVTGHLTILEKGNKHARMGADVHVIATRFYAQRGGDGSCALAGIPPGRYRLHVWHERSPVEVIKDITITTGAVVDEPVTLNARGYRWQAHKNKYGQDYPTNEDRERY